LNYTRICCNYNAGWYRRRAVVSFPRNTFILMHCLKRAKCIIP